MSGTVPIALDWYAAATLGPNWALFALALVLLIARIYTSWRITETIALDLYLAILTFILASISISFFTIAVCYGLGQHVALLSIDQRIEAMRWSWRFVAVSLFAIPIGKFTIIAFLQQLHGPDSRRRNVFLWSLGVSNLIANAITVGIALSTCSPRERLWDIRLNGNCDGVVRNEHCAFFQGSWNAMADLLLALYPITLLYRLQLRTTLKVGLGALMGLGVIACACAIVKTVKLENLEHTDDTTFYVGQLNFWNSIEMWVVLIVACIPPIRKLVVLAVGKVSSTIASRSRREYYPPPIEFGSATTNDIRHPKRAYGTKGDNESEEQILEASSDIRKTVKIDVEH